jgi:hypothetical protein
MRISLRIWELAPLAAMVVFWKALVFRNIKTGIAYIFPQTGPLIVPNQKVTSGALSAVVWTVVEYVRMLLGADGGCAPAGTQTLKLVEIRERGFRGRDRFYLGDCSESPIYRGGGLQSRCSGTPVSGGYEIMGSVTAREFIAGTCRETLWLI